MWLLSTRNETEFPRGPQPRVFTEFRPSQKHLKPSEADLASACSGEELAARLQVPADRVKGWIGGLIPGRQVGRRAFVTVAIAEEVVQIVTADPISNQLPPGRQRTAAATERLEQEMLRRVGIHNTVRSWRYHRGGDQPIRWVPKPHTAGTGTRRRPGSSHSAEPGDDDKPPRESS
jgi:hypothetical protein